MSLIRSDYERLINVLPIKDELLDQAVVESNIQLLDCRQSVIFEPSVSAFPGSIYQEWTGWNLLGDDRWYDMNIPVACIVKYPEAFDVAKCTYREYRSKVASSMRWFMQRHSEIRQQVNPDDNNFVSLLAMGAAMRLMSIQDGDIINVKVTNGIVTGSYEVIYCEADMMQLFDYPADHIRMERPNPLNFRNWNLDGTFAITNVIDCKKVTINVTREASGKQKAKKAGNRKVNGDEVEALEMERD